MREKLNILVVDFMSFLYNFFIYHHTQTLDIAYFNKIPFVIIFKIDV